MARNLLACKWALQIVVELVHSPKRPSELRRRIEGIEERVLFDRLKRLTEAGLLRKKANSGYPKETFYYLSEPERFKPLAEWLVEIPIPLSEVTPILSCRWTLEIMELLLERRTPGEIKELLGGLNDKTLHKRLSQLERLGLAEREVLPTKPVSVFYKLSERGRELLPLLKRMKDITLYSGRTRSPDLSPVRDS
jgi:DNA-binding HxlR family transcriptional regulator